MARDLTPGSGSTFSASDLYTAGGLAYFFRHYIDAPNELWVSDGTAPSPAPWTWLLSIGTRSACCLRP